MFPHAQIKFCGVLTELKCMKNNSTLKNIYMQNFYPNGQPYSASSSYFPWGINKTQAHKNNSTLNIYIYAEFLPKRTRSLLSSTDSGQNLGNSRNSGGIKFGRGACQIEQMIPTEFQTEFKFRRNGSWNHPEGMNS